MSKQQPDTQFTVGHKQAVFSLIVLMLVTIFTNADRALMTVLIEPLKADIGLSDSEIGFIFGTAISVFYALFSIPLGRLADVGNRKNLVSIGIAACSVMIAVTASAKSFLSLAACRIGVGAGESSAAPASLSILADCFPIHWRATAMGIFNCGVYVGSGLGVFFGGYLIDYWAASYPQAELAPFTLKPWQIPLLALGLIGLCLSPLIAMIKEPQRGLNEGLFVAKEERPLQEAWLVMKTVIPVVSLMALYRKAGWVAVKKNLSMLLLLSMVSGLLIYLTGSWSQWVALLFGFYCVFCWVQSFSLSDNASFQMIFRCKALVFMFSGLSLFVFLSAAMLTWVAPFFQRSYGMSASEVGAIIGMASIASGLAGTLLGGLLADMGKRFSSKSPFYVMIFSTVVVGPLLYLMLTADQVGYASVYYALYVVVASLWFGIAPAVTSELVMPRMRGVTSALFLICITFIGFSLGPYIVGYISDALVLSGFDKAQALSVSLLSMLTILPIALIFLCLGLRHYDQDRLSRIGRAESLGESVQVV